MSPGGTCILSYQLPFISGKNGQARLRRNPSPAAESCRSGESPFPAVFRPSGTSPGPEQGKMTVGISFGLLGRLFESRDGDPYADCGPLHPDDPDLLQALEEGDDRVAVPSPLLGEAGVGDVEPAGPVVRVGSVSGGLPLQQAAESVEAREAFALGLAEHPGELLGQRVLIARALYCLE